MGGLGNIFIHLTQVDTVSDTVYSNKRRKYIRLEGIRVIPDDGTLPSLEPNTYVNQPFHKVIRSIVKPTDEMNVLIEKYKHLVDDVSFALQIRRCAFVKNKEFGELTQSPEFCTDDMLEKFYTIMNTSSGNVFVTSDCQHVKREFQSRWPDRVRILDEQPIHTTSMNDDIDPWVSFLEFFLLSKCPYIFVTSGNLISTFGYMAAMYGNVPFSYVV